MCEECHMSVCPSGCPNYPELNHIHCIGCNGEIYDGDFYYKVRESLLCEDCLKKEYGHIYDSKTDEIW